MRKKVRNMKEEVHSIFDQFETDEETGEVIIPRATVGVARDPEPEKSTFLAEEEADADAPEVKEAVEAEETPEAGKEAAADATGAEKDAEADVPEAEKEVEADVPEVEKEAEADVPEAEKEADADVPETEEAAEAEETPETEEEAAADAPEAEATIAAEETPESEEGPAAAGEDGLPVIDMDLNFTEEDLVEVKEDADKEEDSLLKSIDAALEQEMASAMGEDLEAQEKEEKKKNFWTRLPLWLRITGISVVSLFLIVALIIGTKPGRKIVYRLMAGYIWGRVEHPSEGLTPELPQPTDIAVQPTEGLTPGLDDPDLTPGIEDPELTPPPITPPPPGAPRQEDYCYNILLIGVEALEYFGTGERSDSMIILSINKKDKKLRLTSLMRDMIVSINGYPDNRLNAAYAKGGASLLVDTIERNLKVKIDDYVKVSFSDFEWIIDRLGGVEITLTEREASYLRTTRYITNPAYRNVVAGTQLMNGNQVLGYCRVRKVPTASGTDSDFGRTERQRTVLTKLFNKYKEKNIWTLLGILNDCLPHVTTSMSKDTMSELLETVVEERILTLETKRIPVANSYENVYYTITGDTLPSQVLVIKWPQNIEALQEFVFGTGEEEE